jgi:hypothetical protein
LSSEEGEPETTESGHNCAKTQLKIKRQRHDFLLAFRSNPQGEENVGRSIWNIYAG